LPLISHRSLVTLTSPTAVNGAAQVVRYGQRRAALESGFAEYLHDFCINRALNGNLFILL